MSEPARGEVDAGWVNSITCPGGEPVGAEPQLGTDELAALAAWVQPPAVRHAPDGRRAPAAGGWAGDGDEEGEPAPADLGRPEAFRGLEPPGPAVALPRQRDEFTCTRCFLVSHVSRQASPGVCADCC